MSLAAIERLPERLIEFHQQFRRYLRTRTRDTSEYGYHYLSGLLRMEGKRNMANIGRTAEVAEQNMQQFSSDSPWSGPGLIEGIQAAISERAEFQEGSVLLLDESAEVKAGEESAGAKRQHNGRLGKVELSQVGVFAALANGGFHTWIDGELFLPECWFSPAYAGRRKRVGLPAGHQFQTKLELALQIARRVRDNGVPFAAVDCDALYGRSGWLRDELNREQMEYYADIPAHSQVYLQAPLVYWPTTKRGKPAKKAAVVGSRYWVNQLLDHSQTEWQTLTLRPHERGFLRADFARRRVWTVRLDGSLRCEWLLIRRDATDDVTYSLSNASSDITLFTMAQRKSQRALIERSNQDAKSELGWDEFQAIKYRPWQHHLAFTILASWFVTETKLDWTQQYPPHPDLLTDYQTDALPALSVANVRTLLQAAMPLPQLSPHQAAQLVSQHLDNRTRSRISRLKKALSP